MPDITLYTYSGEENTYDGVDELEVPTDDGGSTVYISEHLIMSQKQSDWNQEDETQSDFIKNKPNIQEAVQVATTEIAGKVKPDGATITIDPDGTIRATFAIATLKKAGLVMPDGITITIDENGVIRATCEIATVDKAGIVKPDGDTVKIDSDGTIHAANAGYSREEVDTMLQELSDMLMTNSDLEMVYAATNTLMGEETEFTGLGASLLTINALADELLA